MNEDETFFLGESVRHAKTLTVGDCTRFVAGMIFALGETHPAIPRLRRVVTQLMDSDAQLELIKLGQLKLDLETPRRRRGGKS
jgi:hypothetical protein